MLKFFPAEAFHALTAMSERSLAYSTEPLKHRHLVVYEAAGMASDFATYLIRSLLSEGRLRYETVEKTKDGLGPEDIGAGGTNRADRHDDQRAAASGERDPDARRSR